MLERAGIVCDRQNFRADADLAEAFALVTEAPAQVLGRATPLQVGARGRLLPAAGWARSPRRSRRGRVDRWVFRGGVLIARGGRLVGANA